MSGVEIPALISAAGAVTGGAAQLHSATKPQQAPPPQFPSPQPLDFGGMGQPQRFPGVSAGGLPPGPSLQAPQFGGSSNDLLALLQRMSQGGQ